MQRDKVILVNERDEWIGTATKETAHHEGLLHRAISVFITNNNGEILLQQRAGGKYHSAGLWSNACCTHPVPGESTTSAAHRRLGEELGIITPLTKTGTFQYHAQVSDDMQEHELDHLFNGVYDGEITPDVAEVQAWKWISQEELERALTTNPGQFSAWFPKVFEVWLAHTAAGITAEKQYAGV